MPLRDHACECDSRSCRERVYLTEFAYKQASARGRVVTLEHAAGARVERHRTYAIVTQDRARRGAQAERKPQAVSLAGRSSSVSAASTTRSFRSATPSLATPGGTRA
jgi:hypothetical protein